MSYNLDLFFAHVICYSSGHCLELGFAEKAVILPVLTTNIAMKCHLLTFLVILALFSQASGFCGKESDFFNPFNELK